MATEDSPLTLPTMHAPKKGATHPPSSTYSGKCFGIRRKRVFLGCESDVDSGSVRIYGIRCDSTDAGRADKRPMKWQSAFETEQ